MMNKRIRSMIDEIFAELKMTAENLALRDELMANAQARYEDSVAQGKSEEEAFAEVAASLGDVRALLNDMNGDAAETDDGAEAAEADVQPENAAEEAQAAEKSETEEKAETAEKSEAEEKTDAAHGGTDLEDALNKAFAAMGDLGRQFVPQTKKVVSEVDKATGGILSGLGKAVNKGMRDAQKVAEDVIDKLSDEKGAIVIDFGKPKNPNGDRKESDVSSEGEASPEALREQAKDLRAQAGLKAVTGDDESARELREQADLLDTKADALEQERAMEEARRAAQDATSFEETDGTAENEKTEEDVFARTVESVTREAERIASDAARVVRDAVDGVDDAAYTEKSQTVVTQSYPAEGLRTVDVGLDADDVTVKPSDGTQIEVSWESAEDEGNAPVITSDGHTLMIRRKNPDVFKTFFSVFQKAGGKVTVRVPRGYAADYVVATTSGNVRLYGLDVDDVKINSTSGDIRLEPDAGIRAKDIEVNTVSGDVTVSACAGNVNVKTVSGDQFVSCDANHTDIDSVSGAVRAEGACEAWEISTVSGEVQLLCTVAPTKKIDLGTLSGNVRVALPNEIRGFVADISGVSGAIVNEFGPNRYGTCALPIHMDTMSGKLTLTRL